MSNTPQTKLFAHTQKSNNHSSSISSSNNNNIKKGKRNGSDKNGKQTLLFVAAGQWLFALKSDSKINDEMKKSE